MILILFIIFLLLVSEYNFNFKLSKYQSYYKLLYEVIIIIDSNKTVDIYVYY